MGFCPKQISDKKKKKKKNSFDGIFDNWFEKAENLFWQWKNN